jgi:peptidoglycan/LPS O-acetylase OafA/YrhL
MNKRLQALDAQRGLCALLVALYHAKGISHFNGLPFVQGAWLLVDFFFVLSGFVIAFVYLDHIENKPTLIGFVIRRFGRLWPLHAFVLLLYIVSEILKATGSYGAGTPVHTAPFTDAPPPSTIAIHLLMAHSLGILDEFSWNPPSWSISVEFYTYLVFAVLCIAVRRWMAIAALTLVGVSIVVLWLWSDNYLGTSLTLGIFRCWYGFFVGVLTLFCYRFAGSRGLLASSILEIGSLLLVIMILIVGRDAGPITLIAPIVFAGMVFLFAQEGGVVSQLFKTRPLLWLGDRSYAIYMVHYFIGDTFVRTLSFAGSVLRVHIVTDTALGVSFGDVFVTDVYVVLYMVAVLVCADLIHRAIELPGRRYFNHIAATYAQGRIPAPLEAVQTPVVWFIFRSRGVASSLIRQGNAPLPMIDASVIV